MLRWGQPEQRPCGKLQDVDPVHTQLVNVQTAEADRAAGVQHVVECGFGQIQIWVKQVETPDCWPAAVELCIRLPNQPEAGPDECPVRGRRGQVKLQHAQMNVRTPDVHRANSNVYLAQVDATVAAEVAHLEGLRRDLDVHLT